MRQSPTRHFKAQLLVKLDLFGVLAMAFDIPSLKDSVHPDEWQLRLDLAACYRLVALYGWSDLVFTHITAKLPDSVTGGQDQFLINPYGLMFDEITASSLVKVDMQCNKLHDTPFPVNPAGFVIHSAVHEVRHDAGCVLHTHTRAGVAVSAQKHGVLPISQQSTFVLASLAYHGYEGVAIRDDEKTRLQADLGDANYLMLRNHGLLTVGKTIADAFLAMYTFENTCRIQVDALAGQAGAQDLTAVNPQILDGVAHASRVQTGGLGGQFVWPSLLRKLQRESPGPHGVRTQCSFRPWAALALGCVGLVSVAAEPVGSVGHVPAPSAGLPLSSKRAGRHSWIAASQAPRNDGESGITHEHRHCERSVAIQLLCLIRHQCPCRRHSWIATLQVSRDEALPLMH
eukprot:gene22749-27723_t